MTLTLSDLTKGALDVASQALRIPLHVATAVAKPGHADTWAPVLVLDQAEAEVRGFFGSLLHDATLTTQADRQRARLTARRRVAETIARAEHTNRLADELLRERAREVDADRPGLRGKANRLRRVVQEEKLHADRRAAEHAAARRAAVVEAAIPVERVDGSASS